MPSTEIKIKYEKKEGTLTLEYENPFFIQDTRFKGNPYINGVLFLAMARTPLIGYYMGPRNRSNYEGIISALNDCKAVLKGFEYSIKDAPNLLQYIEMEKREGVIY